MTGALLVRYLRGLVAKEGIEFPSLDINENTHRCVEYQIQLPTKATVFQCSIRRQTTKGPFDKSRSLRLSFAQYLVVKLSLLILNV